MVDQSPPNRLISAEIWLNLFPEDAIGGLVNEW